MDATAMMAGGLIGAIIGIAIGGVIGGLLIMLGSKIVMGSAAQFPRAFFAAVLSAIAGAIIGFVLGFVVASAAPNMMGMVQIASMVIGLIITPFIYSAIIVTGDGRKPSVVQSFLIYLVQLIIVLVIGAIAVTVFRIPIPGLPTF